MGKYRNLLVTVEHAATGKMGGIGSYNNEIDKLTDNLLILLIDDTITESPAKNIILCHKYLERNMPELLDLYDDANTHHYAVYLAVKRILSEHPEIKNIDTHEYAAEAARIAEASRFGLLGDGIRVRTHCHGGRIQLERATGEWDAARSVGSQLLERTVMECSDELWFSSNYLKNLYIDAGVRIDSKRVRVLGLPYVLENRDLSADYTTIDKIVFIGRVNKLKGYDVLADVVSELVDSSTFANVKEVAVVGKNDRVLDSQRKSLQNVLASKNILYSEGLKTRDEVLEYINDNAGNALFILPYYSDNYSVAMLEIIEAGAPLLALNTGGNAELVDSEEWRSCLAKDKDDLLRLTEDMLILSADERKVKCMTIRDIFIRHQRDTNELNRKRFYDFADKQLMTDPGGVRLARVVFNKAVVPDEITGSDYTHVLMTPKDVDVKEDIVIHAVAELSLREKSAVISFGYSEKGKVVTPHESDLAELVLGWSKHRLICTDINTYNNFIKRLVKEGMSFGSTEEMFVSYMMYCNDIEAAVRVYPESIASVGRLDSYVTDESSYHRYISMLEKPNWDTYHSVARLRANLILPYPEPVSNSDKIADMIWRGQYGAGKKGLLIRASSKALLNTVAVAVKLRRALK